jgi:hypothetical protein
MAFTSSQKRTAFAINPLLQTNVLEHVLSYVGPGHWLFLSTVCSLWLEAYAKLSAVTTATATVYAACKASILCELRMTLSSAIFASPSRLTLAQEWGRQLLSRQCQFTAGSYADVETLVAARELGLQYTDATRAGAAYRLAWLYAMCGPQDCRTTAKVFSLALQAGSVAALDWLKRTQQGVVFTQFTCVNAARLNQLPVLQYLRSVDCPWSGRVLAEAASSGALELLRWAVDHGCPLAMFQHDSAGDSDQSDDDEFDNYILHAAAHGGHIELLSWVKQRFPELQYDVNVMSAAVRKGHTAMCEHLLADGCPWSSDCCEAAADSNQASTLQWLRESECPCDNEAVCIAAAENGSVEVMTYMLDNGLITSAALLTQMLKATGEYEQQLAAAQWLRQQGAEWPAVLQGWCGEMLAWARAEGCTSPTA